MNITKFDHSGFLLEKNGRGLLFDPVEYSNKLPKLKNIDVIIITHKHSDHFNPKIIEKIRKDNPKVKIFTTGDNAANIPGSTAVKGGDKMKVGGFDLEFYGKDHAEIISWQVPCQNIGTLVDGIFANSGDSFAEPPVQPKILLAPIAAPWLKIGEAMDFISSVKPRIVIPTHDALNSEIGDSICDTWTKRICDDMDIEYKSIHFGKVM